MNVYGGQIFIIKILIFSIFSCCRISANVQEKDNSAYLARIRQLRQNAHQNGGNSRQARQIEGTTFIKSAMKGKRYKCYLVDDDDGEDGSENEADVLQQIPRVAAVGQNSYFVNFQRDGEESWEGGEGTRRSEGARPRYLYGTDRRKNSAETSSRTPMIEYIDYETGDENAQNIPLVTTQKPIETKTFKTTTKATNLNQIPAKQPFFKAKIHRRPLQSEFEKTAENFDDFQGQAESDNEEEEELLYNDDLHITTTSPRTTTTRKPTQITKRPQHSQQVLLPKALAPNSGTSFAAGNQQKPQKGKTVIPPKAIPRILEPDSKHEHVSQSVESSEEELDSTWLQPQQPIVAIAPPKQPTFAAARSQNQNIVNSNRIPTNPTNFAASNSGPSLRPQLQQVAANIAQFQPQQQQQIPPFTAIQARTDPIRDAQGRPLILSPEHCKMIDSYAQLYGLRSANNVIGFVHNNCAFAKLFLPSASCAEIDILVASCYQQQRKRNNKNL